jgi:hypothetical protein
MIRLFVNWYEDANKERQKEIDLCLRKNLANPLLNVIVIESQEKLTYSSFFKRVNNLAQANDISIIANSDIFFDETIALSDRLRAYEVFALSRWEWYGEGQPANFCNRQDSQDAWIFRGIIRQVNGDFTLGKAGCDNRIAYEFTAAQYKVLNPSKSIKTYHVHNTGIRNYNPNDVVPQPYYCIPPTI